MLRRNKSSVLLEEPYENQVKLRKNRRCDLVAIFPGSQCDSGDGRLWFHHTLPMENISILARTEILQATRRTRESAEVRVGRTNSKPATLGLANETNERDFTGIYDCDLFRK